MSKYSLYYRWISLILVLFTYKYSLQNTSTYSFTIMTLPPIMSTSTLDTKEASFAFEVYFTFGDVFWVNCYPHPHITPFGTIQLYGQHFSITAYFTYVLKFNHIQYIVAYTTIDHYAGEGFYLALDYNLVPLSWYHSMLYYWHKMCRLVRAKDHWCLPRPSMQPHR